MSLNPFEHMKKKKKKQRQSSDYNHVLSLVINDLLLSLNMN